MPGNVKLKREYARPEPGISFGTITAPEFQHHVDQRYTIFLLLDGYADAVIDDKSFVISSPAFICLSNLQTMHIKSGNSFCAKYLTFHPTFINRNMTFENISSNNFNNLCDKHDFFRLEPFISLKFSSTYITGLSPEMRNRANELFEACRHELDVHSDWYWSCRTRSNFMDLLHIVERLYFNKNPSISKSAYDFEIKEGYEDVQNVLIYIWSQYQNPDISVSNICKLIAVDACTLNRRFKKITNTSVCEYIQSYRLYVASFKLRFTELSIQEITDQSGFQSPAYFTKIFKKRFGLPPNQFRKQVLSERLALNVSKG